MDSRDTTDINLNQSDDSLARNSLERIRQRLVDTSARNRLINCRLDRTQVIRLVDELPDQVYTRLSEGKPFAIQPVPAPTHQELLDEGYIEFDEHTGECIKDTKPKADAWARRAGINTEYDLPSGSADEIKPGHSDNNLQTLHFPDVLNARLNKLRQMAKTAMEESGANILYLALGCLEWYESSSSNTPRLSPLFVVPVDLNRDKRLSSDGLRTFQIKLRDDGLFNNVSLSQRMAQDFYLDMPEVTDDSQPESYFDAVTSIIAPLDSRWKVRRYASLCLLDFTKQLMYEDLDPTRWPADKSIADHPLLEHFLSAGDNPQQGSDGATRSEHLIDEMANVHAEFPLIYEADSSQHSALIDVVNGENLVIEGPPGTGKSQTITNLIAACINKGLSVLFVAEKLAALEVVKRRLDSADLGDFCLEVHSHKSSKLSILESLMASQKRRSNVMPPTELQQQINRYEGHKNTLHHYAEKLNEPWQESGLTPHQILQRATNFGDLAPLTAGEYVVHVNDPSEISASFISDTLEAAERLRIVFEAVAEQTPNATIDTHPWFGVRNGNVAGPQRQAMIDTLEQWTEQQQHVMTLWANLQNDLHITPVAAPHQVALMTLMSTLDDLPNDIPEVLLQRVEELRDCNEGLDALAEHRDTLRERFAEFSSLINPQDLLNVERSTATAKALLAIRDDLGLTGTAPLDKAVAHAEQLGVLETRIIDLHEETNVLEGLLPAAFTDIFEPSLNGLELLCELLEISASLPAKLWPYRDDRYRDNGFLSALDDMEPIILSLRKQHSVLAEMFSMDRLPESRTLEDLERILANGGLFGFLKSDYREAMRSLNGLARGGVKTADAKTQLHELVRFQQEMDKLSDIHRRNPALGSAYQSIDTKLDLHRTLGRWYESVSARFAQHALRQSPKAVALFTLDDEAARILASVASSDLIGKARGVQNSFDKLREIYPQYFSNFGQDSHVLDNAVGIRGLIDRIESCLTQIGQSLLDPSVPLSELIDVVTRWSNSVADHQEWAATLALPTSSWYRL